MSTAESFKNFLENIKVDKAEIISMRYREITSALNKEFRNNFSGTDNSLQFGSYGRHTGIKGISDLDMIYIMPSSLYETYKGSPKKLLVDVKAVISRKYPKTHIRVDRYVVVVSYKNFKIEIQPSFEHKDDTGLTYFTYPDTYYGGRFRIAKTRQEISAFQEFNTHKSKNLRKLCKMIRAWKNNHGIPISGLLIDTLAYNFFNKNSSFNNKSYKDFGIMCTSFFAFLSKEQNQPYYLAPGSNQRVKVLRPFQPKAKKAYELCIKALEATTENIANAKWKKIFGRFFPTHSIQLIANESFQFDNTEQFIEDFFPVDIQYLLEIDCDVLQNGFRQRSLLQMLKMKLPLFRKKDLTFKIISNEAQPPFEIKWKILNRGGEAEKRNMIRGQIIADEGNGKRTEHTDFKGNHIVECYIIKEEVVIARSQIRVPIRWESHEQE